MTNCLYQVMFWCWLGIFSISQSQGCSAVLLGMGSENYVLLIVSGNHECYIRT